jgi:glycosyltransferase involved in cell wall biosynthesis
MLKIRVLFVIDKIMIGGAEQVFLDIIELLENKIEIHVLIITKTEHSQLQRIPPRIKIFELNRSNKFSLLTIWECKNILGNYDLVHIHMRHTYRYISTIRKLFNLNAKLIFHDHYGKIQLDENPPFALYDFLRPDFYIGVSEGLSIWAQNVWGIPRNRTTFLQNLPRANAGNMINSKLFHCEFVIVGNIKPVKNQNFAIELVGKINNSSIEVIGKLQDKNYYDSLKKFSNVNFNLTEDNASNKLNEFKFGLCTSLSESGPLVILEYFVAGLPFLSYKTGGIADVLYKYVPEYFLDTFELNDWIDRYEHLNRNYKRIPFELIEKVLEKEFNREEYAHKLIDIYTRCLNSAS